MPDVQHQALTEPDAIHPAAYVGTTDPATSYPTQIAAKQLWIDTTGGTFVMKKRNDANSGWDTVATLTHNNLSGLTTADPHTQYVLRSLFTTKGDLAVRSSTEWVRFPVGTDGYVLVADADEATGMKWATAAAIALMALDDLTDVNAPSPTNGQVLAWDSTPGEWVPVTPAGGATVIDDLTDVDTTTTPPADGDLLQWNDSESQWVPWGGLIVVSTNIRRVSIAFQLGDGTNAITTSEREQWLTVNFDGTIEGWDLLADVSGSIVVDIYKDTYANYPPVSGDSITASAKPTLSSAAKNQSFTLTGWTTSIVRGDTLKIHVDSAATVKAATLTLYVLKSL